MQINAHSYGDSYGVFNGDFTVEAILDDQYITLTIETIEVCVSHITDKTRISTIINELTLKFPLNNLTHLKRINKTKNAYEVIICLNSEMKDAINFCGEYGLSAPEVRLVPLRPPLTRQQYNESIKLWATSFHENKYVERCLNGSLFDANQRQTILTIMSKAIELRDKCESKQVVVAVVADGSHIITSGRCSVDTNPTKHAIMVAIDRVAVLDGGGSWTHHELQDWPQTKTKLKINSYLCTGYDVYVTQEPCIMCAMALVHSRIKRLFFIECETSQTCDHCSDKAITRHKLHTLANLNHHFEAWKLILK